MEIVQTFNVEHNPEVINIAGSFLMPSDKEGWEWCISLAFKWQEKHAQEKIFLPDLSKQEFIIFFTFVVSLSYFPHSRVFFVLSASGWKKPPNKTKFYKNSQSWKTKCRTKKMSRHEGHIFCIHDTLTWSNPFYQFYENSANVLSSEINDILDMFSELLFWYKYVIQYYSVVIKNWIAIKYWQFQYLKSK